MRCGNNYSLEQNEEFSCRPPETPNKARKVAEKNQQHGHGPCGQLE